MPLMQMNQGELIRSHALSTQPPGCPPQATIGCLVDKSHLWPPLAILRSSLSLDPGLRSRSDQTIVSGTCLIVFQAVEWAAGWARNRSRLTTMKKFKSNFITPFILQGDLKNRFNDVTVDIKEYIVFILGSKSIQKIDDKDTNGDGTRLKRDTYPRLVDLKVRYL